MENYENNEIISGEGIYDETDLVPNECSEEKHSNLSKSLVPFLFGIATGALAVVSTKVVPYIKNKIENSKNRKKSKNVSVDEETDDE